jgi:hypothetical protein
MKRKIYVLFILIFWTIQLNVFAQQTNMEKVDEWYQEKTKGVHSRDLSPVFYYENCSYIGIWGENCRKINIRLDTVFRDGLDTYHVEGFTLLKNRKNEFEGYIKIQNLKFSYIHGDCSSKEPWLPMSVGGRYHFTEKNNHWEFKGKYIKHFVQYIKSEEISTNDGDLGEVRDGFAGVWIDKTNNKTYDCYFGFQRYPQSLSDFDVNGGENIMRKKYKNHGWESYYNIEEGKYGHYLNVECGNTWWEE